MGGEMTLEGEDECKTPVLANLVQVKSDQPVGRRVMGGPVCVECFGYMSKCVSFVDAAFDDG
jgi:hypothetical protein